MTLLSGGVVTTMQAQIEQRSNVKMLTILGKSQAEIHRTLSAAYGESAISLSQVRMWFLRFKADPEAPVSDRPHPGMERKRTQDQDKVIQFLQTDKRSTLRQVTAGTGLSTSTVHRIMTKDLNYSKLAPKFIPRILTPEQKACRVRISQQNLDRIRSEPGFLQRIVTTDESWVFSYDPCTKMADLQCTTPEEPCPVKALRSRSQKKTMLVLFFDCQGVVHLEFVDKGMITTERYIQILRRFRESVRRKRPQLWIHQRDKFILLQDSASAHTSNLAAEYFHKVDMDLLSHPPYSPDLAPCDFWAFPHLKKIIRGHRFLSLDDLKVEVSRTLRSIPEETFREAMDKLAVWYQKCIDAQGDYFEGQGKRGLGPT